MEWSTASAPMLDGEPRQPSASLITQPTSLSLPKGGGALRGIGEKFAANPVTGTGSFSVPITTSPGRAGFGPTLSLSYDSGSGNSPFGFGWSLHLPEVTRRTDKGLPCYRDDKESDVFVLTGVEDLVPLLTSGGSRHVDTTTHPGWTVHRYRPRIEGLFARIERWTRADGDVHWRSISQDNVLSVFGRDHGSRIADPADSRRVFSWLLTETRDDKGEVVIYDYRAEDGAGVNISAAHQRSRGAISDRARTANRYIKRIRYGNRTPLLDPDGHRPDLLDQERIDGIDWLFEVVFDYGEHDLNTPGPAATANWPLRDDPFSSFRPGFEVRTNRLCRRVLMFHHFPGEPGVGRDCLVRSTDLTFGDQPALVDPHAAGYAQLTGVTQRGYRRRSGSYLRRSLPTVEFGYTVATLQEIVHDVDADTLANLPIGLDGALYRWLDLHGEGLPGLFSEQAGAWLYQRNISPISTKKVEFAPIETVSARPTLSLAGAQPQFLDLAGQGHLDLVVLAGRGAGLAEHDDAEGWHAFRPFSGALTLDPTDPNLRLVDLDGNGLSDAVVTEDGFLVWYPSLGTEGFAPGRRVQQAADEELGPRLLFADGTRSIHLADMTGDGLTDLVRIGPGEVCYWPNLGHGRFGAKIDMDGAPELEQSGHYDPGRLRLADIDGSGTTDLIYLQADKVQVHLNRSGNGWAVPRVLTTCPATDELAVVTPVDLLGNGTVCLVWSTPLASTMRDRMRYIQLMGEHKPHLLTRVTNNLGAETRISYAPSSIFYLRDKYAGRPWLTKLGFPVHVVERVQTLDLLSGNRFVCRYAYHHGYFDDSDREFRGFGMVEQWDTEEFAALTATGDLPPDTNVEVTSHVPPVLTRTWFHTGRYTPGGTVPGYVEEYFREPGGADLSAYLLPDTVLAGGWSSEEEREACRALKGAQLRQEVYGLDDTPQAVVPYVTVEQNLTVRRLQPLGANRHGVFFTHPREALTHHYERFPHDPRSRHDLTLEVDERGNVLRSALVAYGRRQPDSALTPAERAEQAATHLLLTVNSVTNAVDTVSDHRGPVGCETRSYEVTGATLPFGRLFFDVDSTLAADDGALPLPYEAVATPGQLEKRLVEHHRTLLRRDDLTGPLPLGVQQPLALPYEAYSLALTHGVVDQVFGARATSTMLSGGGFVHAVGDPGWWVPSGQSFFSPRSSDTPAQELAHARQHFYRALRQRTPFHTATLSHETTLSYDHYDLLPTELTDALGNRSTVGQRTPAGLVDPAHPGNDYRILAARLVTDANGNRAAVAVDALGLVVGTAVMGKPAPGTIEGDSLEGFEPDPDETLVVSALADPVSAAPGLLGGATTRLVYDVLAYQRSKAALKRQPASVLTLARETHASQPAPPSGPGIRLSVSYSDGFGRDLQRKVQAEPDPLPRWVATGWTVYDNKGSPVRSFEPFFTSNHRFEPDFRVGVSPILCRDPVSRVVATVHPDHSWSKSLVGAWRQESWDANDTVLVADPGADPDVGGQLNRLPNTSYLPTWHQRRQLNGLGPLEQDAADKAAVHTGTSTVTHTDSLGRTFLTVASNAFKYQQPPFGPPMALSHRSRISMDIEGNQRSATDAEGRVCLRSHYDMLGGRIAVADLDAGRRRTLNDIAGMPLYGWDDRGQRFRTSYDQLRRATAIWLLPAGGSEVQISRTTYGESRANPELNNLRGHPVEVFDQAGVATTDAYDFAGRLLRSSRRLAEDYRGTLDWSSPVALQAKEYVGHTHYDALGRATEQTTPDGTVVRPRYNQGGLLERLEANLRGARTAGVPDWTSFVTGVDYDARGRRTEITYGNGVRTRYAYHPLTSRLSDVVTARVAPTFADDRPQPAPAGWPGSQVQNLHYTYDPVGNVTHLEDQAQQTRFFRNRRVEPSTEYTYDALYRLIEATGREHLGQAGHAASSYRDSGRIGIDLDLSDGTAMGRYRESYGYDRVGNLLQLAHRGTDPAHPGWVRTYSYAEAGRLDAATVGNRLTRTTATGITETYSVGGNGYDAHGNLLRLPHLQELGWSFDDQLRLTRRQAVNALDSDGLKHSGEVTWYVYGSDGTRVRKVTELASGKLKDERMYLSGYEVYRSYLGAGLERETLHLLDGTRRIALVETRTEGNEPGVPATLTRYQFDNLVGSVGLELDAKALIISYEEFTPFGSTSYQTSANQGRLPKRYRYAGRERDEESGLGYHGARYYAPWLGRWISADPAGHVDGPNLYVYCRDNPVSNVDPGGTQTKSSEPSVLRVIDETLEAKGIAYNTETTVRISVTLPDKTTLTVTRRFDRFYQEPQGSWVAFEAKGKKPAQMTTAEELIDRALQENGGRFEVVQSAGKPPASPKVEGISLQEGFAGDLKPGNTHWAHGSPGHISGGSDPHALDAGAWRAGMNAKYPDAAPRGDGVRYSKPNQPPQTLTQAEAVAAAPNSSIAAEAKAAKAATPAGGAVAEAKAASPLASAPEGLAASRAARRATSGGFVDLGMGADAVKALPKAVAILGEVLTVYGATAETDRTDRMLAEAGVGSIERSTNAAAMMVVGVFAGLVDDAFAAAQVPMMGAPAMTQQSWDEHGSGPIQHLAGEAYRDILKWGWRHGL